MNCANCYEDHGPIPVELDNYDWGQVFKYAEPSVCELGEKHPGPQRVIFSHVSAEAFKREDVKRVIAMVDGENDADNWVGVFELNGGRFASISAGCDYTGWG